MKKLLSILSVCLLSTSSTVAVIGCSKKPPNPLEKLAKDLNGKTFNLDNSTKNYANDYNNGKTWSSTKSLTDAAIVDQMKSIYNISLTSDQVSWLDWDATSSSKWKYYTTNTVSNLKIKHNNFTATISKMIFNVSDAIFTPQDLANELNEKTYQSPSDIVIGESVSSQKASINKKLLSELPGLTADELNWIHWSDDLVKKGNTVMKNIIVSDGKQNKTATINKFTLHNRDDGSKPTIPDQLSNYKFDIDKFSVRPIDVTGSIDYSAKIYKPWYDAGFNWQQFLDNKNGNAGVGDVVINKVLDSKSNIINLGFITSWDEKNNPPPPQKPNVYTQFKTWVNGQPKETLIPTIGGILPLWMANWTSAWSTSLVPYKTTSPSDYVYKFLNEIRKAGKDYVFSFGGWNADSIAMKAYLYGYSSQQLAIYYEKIIDFLNLKMIDFDIEGTESGGTDDFGNTHPAYQGEAAKMLRFAAIKILKATNKYKNIHINLTFPTSIDGLATNEHKLQLIIDDMLKNNIIDRINLMVFDYGQWKNGKRITIPGETALYSMSSVNSYADTLKAGGVNLPYSRIEATTMVGVHDNQYEVWTLTDQALFNNFAIYHKLGGLAMWSIINDMEQHLWNAPVAFRAGHHFGKLWTFNDMLNGTGKKDAFSGGLLTTDLAYSNIFKNFNNNKKVDFNGKINIAPQLWTKIKSLGIVPDVDITNITENDIDNLTRTNYVFSVLSGLGPDFQIPNQGKDALQTELNFAMWKDMYKDKTLN